MQKDHLLQIKPENPGVECVVPIDASNTSDHPLVTTPDKNGWCISYAPPVNGLLRTLVISYTDCGEIIYRASYPVLEGVLLLGVDDIGFPIARLYCDDRQQQPLRMDKFELLAQLGLSCWIPIDVADAFNDDYVCDFRLEEHVSFAVVVTGSPTHGTYDPAEHKIRYHLDDSSDELDEWAVVFELHQNGIATSMKTTLFAPSLKENIASMRRYLKEHHMCDFRDLISFWPIIEHATKPEMRDASIKLD